MKEFIEKVMLSVFKDFETEVDNLDCCCVLKELRFDSVNIPDYSLPIIQQLYLLRYFPAYLVEYYDIYKHLLKYEFLDFPWNILSIGTGCGLDYYGAVFVLDRAFGSISGRIRYTGIDLVKWKYRDKFNNDKCYFIEHDITQCDEFDEDEYNIIIFPKSIGEFTDDGFEKLKNIIKNTNFISTHICLISSLRDKRDASDVHRFRKIVSLFDKEHDYNCLDKKNEFWYYENEALINVFPDFCYPDEVLGYITKLLNKCKNYKENKNTSCESNCDTLLNRYPILRTKYIKYQLLRLQRD